MSDSVIFILLGAFLSLLGGFIGFILEYYVKDKLSEKKRKRLIKTNLSMELQANKMLLDEHGAGSIKYHLLDEVLRQTILSGDFNFLEEDLMTDLISLRGKINVYNHTRTSSAGVPTDVLKDIKKYLNYLPPLLEKL